MAQKFRFCVVVDTVESLPRKYSAVQVTLSRGRKRGATQVVTASGGFAKINSVDGSMNFECTMRRDKRGMFASKKFKAAIIRKKEKRVFRSERAIAQGSLDLAQFARLGEHAERRRLELTAKGNVIIVVWLTVQSEWLKDHTGPMSVASSVTEETESLDDSSSDSDDDDTGAAAAPQKKRGVSDPSISNAALFDDSSLSSDSDDENPMSTAYTKKREAERLGMGSAAETATRSVRFSEDLESYEDAGAASAAHAPPPRAKAPGPVRKRKDDWWGAGLVDNLKALTEGCYSCRGPEKPRRVKR